MSAEPATGAAVAAVSAQETRAVSFQAVLKTKTAGTPIPNQQVDIKWRITGAAAFTDLGNFTTDATGTATAPDTTIPVPNQIDVQANFAGAAGFDPATGSVNSFQLNAGVAVTVSVTPK